ncbi:MAG: CBS domain-containing protein [Planctomycetes bacterium]|nr:CBS domain-containing protein [Planctomycetota bacterium]
MPGFMGLRGLERKTLHDMDRERREGKRSSQSQRHLEKRAREKVDAILRDQGGDMSAFTGHLEVAETGNCQAIARLPVGRIMSGRVAVLSFDDSLLTVQGIFERVRFHHLPVVDEDGRILGIISDRDFLRMVSPFLGTINEQNRDKEIMAKKAGMIMTRNPACTSMDAPIIDVVQTMNRLKISCLPVVDKDDWTLLGIVTWKDVVRAFCPECFPPASESSRLKTDVIHRQPVPETPPANHAGSAHGHGRTLLDAMDTVSMAPGSRHLAPSPFDEDVRRTDRHARDTADSIVLRRGLPRPPDEPTS